MSTQELNLEDLDAELGGAQEDASVDEILGFMDLLAGTKEDRKKANSARSKKAVEEWNKPVPFQSVTWFPEALSLRVRQQTCRCGATHFHTEGVFLRQVTKNGAQKWTQASKEDLEKYHQLERVKDLVEDEVSHCVSCWN